MIISREQMKALELLEGEKFKIWMIAHINKFFLDQVTYIGDEAIKDTIEYGIHQSGLYGFKKAVEICTYIDLMFIFGQDFDTNPAFCWAAEVLKSNTITNTNKKIKILYYEAIKFLEGRI